MVRPLINITWSTLLQERAAELAEHEQSLEAWKHQFKSQALLQIGDRERILTEWQVRLNARDADVAGEKAAFEVP